MPTPGNPAGNNARSGRHQIGPGHLPGILLETQIGLLQGTEVWVPTSATPAETTDRVPRCGYLHLPPLQEKVVQQAGYGWAHAFAPLAFGAASPNFGVTSPNSTEMATCGGHFATRRVLGAEKLTGEI